MIYNKFAIYSSGSKVYLLLGLTTKTGLSSSAVLKWIRNLISLFIRYCIIVKNLMFSQNVSINPVELLKYRTFVGHLTVCLLLCA